MKKLLAIILVFCLAGLPVPAAAGFLDIYKIVSGERGWHTKINAAWDAIQNAALTLTVPEIDYIGNYSNDLPTAVAAIGSARKRLLINAATAVGSNVTVPATLQLEVSREGQLNVATGVTLTINCQAPQGPYQIYNCTGTGKVVFGAGQTVNAAWFGLDGGGVVDNQAALTLALYATPANGILEIPQPTTSYALASTWTIDKAVIIRGLAHSIPSNRYFSGPVVGTKIKWTGGASPMIDMSQVLGVRFENISLDGNATATWGLYIDRLHYGGGYNINITNVATGCLWLGSNSDTHDDNSSWNTFELLSFFGPNLITLSDNATHNSTACNNTFIQTRGNFTGTYGIDLLGSGNNGFYDTFLYRYSGAGYGIHYNQYVHNEYFYHLQAPGAGPQVDIEGLSNAAACVVTWTGHGFQNGDQVYFSGITQANWTALNGNHYSITKLTNDTFSIPVNSTAFGTYVPGTDPGIVLLEGKSVLVDAGAAAGTIFGYDMDNGQVLPEITATGQLTYHSSGNGAYGDFIPKLWMADDILFNNPNSKAIKIEGWGGDGFKLRLNSSTRNMEVWKQENGGGYVQLLDINSTDIKVLNGHVYLKTAGAGIRMITPDGTKLYEVSVDNSGNVITTLMGAPY